MLNQKGAVPLLILVAVIGVVAVISIANFAPFKNTLLSSLYPKSASHAAGLVNISNLTPSAASVGKFQKIEFSFDLDRTYPNPYYFYDPTDTPSTNPSTMSWFGVDGISVDLNVTSPSGKSLKVPAFYFQDYTRIRDNGIGPSGVEVLGRKGNPKWLVRFSPSEVGTYQYFVTAQDKDGTGRFPTSGTQSFNVTSSSAKGFIHQSTKDPRFLAYDDGEPYVPIGAGAQWWGNNATRSFDYEDRFSTYGQNKINLTRIWDQIDFGLAVEGASQLPWLNSNSIYGIANGIEVNTANVHAGLRSAKPTTTQGWYQRLAISDVGKPHKLTAWIKTDSLTGGTAQVNVKTSMLFNQGTVVGQIPGVSGTTAWTQYSVTFTPTTQTVSLNMLMTGTGTMYVDDIAFGPTDTSGNITYNIVSDPDFERHFASGVTGDDPNTDSNLVRPLGSFMNPWAGYEMDKIVESASNNGIAMQVCSCSGPWFTWPNWTGTADQYFAQSWVQKSWQRNFRYRVARWGYSPSVLGWEFANEQGHINPGGTPGIWAFFQTYSAFQKATDPYNHIKTDSQNSGAYSPGLWSSSFMDLANTHWYIDGHLPSLDSDEVSTINRWSWCHRDIARNPNTSPYCQGLGLGDGSTWTGVAKPWVWGEMGVGDASGNGSANLAGTTGEGGARFFHNIVWAGLFTPFGTTPLEWWWYSEDATATNSKLAARKAAGLFFANVDYDGGNFINLMTSNDIPPSYTGETIPSTSTTARVYGLRRADKQAAYFWVQNRNHVWSNTTTPAPISTNVTVNNLLSQPYTVEIWNTSTGVISSTSTQTPTSGSITLSINNLTDDVAVKVVSAQGVPSPSPVASPISSPIPTPSPSKVGDFDGNGKIDIFDYNTLLTNFNKSGAGVVGDITGPSGVPDGVVSIYDYNLLLTNFGH